MLNLKGFALADSLTATTIITIGVPLGCLLSSLVSDKGGRKIPLIVVFASGGVLAFVFAGLEDIVYLTIVGFLLTMISMAGGFMLFSYNAESYPTKLRTSAAGVQNAAARFATSGMMAMVPVIFATGGFWGVYTVGAICLLLPVLVLALFGARTSGKSLEEIS
jgi:putative MFS transporter